MENTREIRPGEIYRHFKNKLYQIIAIAYHSETEEKMVVYQALYGEFKTYVRPYDMFMSEVDHMKYPQVEDKFRFTKYEPGVDCAEVNSDGKDIMVNSDEVATDDEGVNPLLMKFFDMETSADKIEFLNSIRNKIDDRLVSDMAVSMDITLEDKSLEEKIDSLLFCLKTKARYECNRFR